MSVPNNNQKPSKLKEKKRLPYQKPAIIYSGLITTRAGSPAGLTDTPEEFGVDPSDLFSNKND